MKLPIALAALVGLVATQGEFDAIKACMQDRCSDQYAKCANKSGCEAKIEACAGKCGTKVDTVCWGGCLGIFNTVAINVCTCAANQGCLTNGEELNFELMGKLLDSILQDGNLRSN